MKTLRVIKSSASPTLILETFERSVRKPWRIQKIPAKRIRIPTLSSCTARRYYDIYFNKILRQAGGGGGPAPGNNILNIHRRIPRNIKTRHKITVRPALNINTTTRVKMHAHGRERTSRNVDVHQASNAQIYDVCLEPIDFSKKIRRKSVD